MDLQGSKQELPIAPGGCAEAYNEASKLFEERFSLGEGVQRSVKK